MRAVATTADAASTHWQALYKPAAFFKGVLLPLGESGAMLREALTVCSVLAKVSVPTLHSAVAILKLAEMESSG